LLFAAGRRCAPPNDGHVNARQSAPADVLFNPAKTTGTTNACVLQNHPFLPAGTGNNTELLLAFLLYSAAWPKAIRVASSS
jgi:hypothetical protein